MLQLYLFEPAQAGAPPRRYRSPKRAVPVLLWVQLDLLAPAWLHRVEGEDPDEDPFVTAPIIHRTVSARLTPRLETGGIRSVFDMAAAVLSMPSAPAKPEQPEPPRYGVTHREVGVTRHTARRHDETEEWAEKERQRRARQRVPKPTSRARTRSRKLIELIGVTEE